MNEWMKKCLLNVGIMGQWIIKDLIYQEDCFALKIVLKGVKCKKGHLQVFHIYIYKYNL